VIEESTSRSMATAAEPEATLLHLSPAQEDDYPALYEWFSDMSELHLWTNARQPVSFEDFVSDTKSRMRTSLIMVIRETQSGVPIGIFQLYDIAAADGTAAFLIYIAKPWRSAGYGQLATHEILSYVFRSYPLRKIYADVYEFNKLSALLLLAGGFHEVGRLKQHLWWRDRYWDIAKYSCCREDAEALLTRLLGPWADGLGHGAPKGFGRGEAQRLDMALVSAWAPSAFRRIDSDFCSVDGPGGDSYGNRWAGDVADYVDMVYSSREGYAVEEGLPGFAQWAKEEWRAFLLPSSHILHTSRGDDGTLLAALACRDEHFREERATRIWSWASNPNLSSEDRARAEMRVCLECAERALERDRSRLFLYVQKDTPRASCVSRLLGESPQMLPFGNTMVVVSDLVKIIGRGKHMLERPDEGAEGDENAGASN